MFHIRALTRRRVVVLIATVMAVWQTGLASSASAQKLPPTVAAVIDYQRVLRDAVAARSIREQIEARRKNYQDEVSKEEQRLHEEDKAFAKQRSLLTPEAFEKKRRAFEQEVADVQKLVQERRRELNALSAAALNEVKRALIDIVTSIAEERGFNLVLPSSEVLFFSRKIDLTEEVLTKLDEQLPEVNIAEMAQ